MYEFILTANRILAAGLENSDIDEIYEELCPELADLFARRTEDDFQELMRRVNFRVLDEKQRKDIGHFRDSGIFLDDNTSYSPQAQHRDPLMATPTVDRFLGEIANILRAEDGRKLQQYLILEPPYGAEYMSMIEELRRACPPGREDSLEQKCNSLLPEARDGVQHDTPWTAFMRVMVSYFTFLRDGHDGSNLLDTYNAISEVVQ